MSYKEVLRGLTAGEQNNANRFRQFESIRLAEDRERGRERLKAISQFSSSLDGFIKNTVDKQIEEDKLKGKLAAIEQDMESREVTGQANIPQEDFDDYFANKETLLDSKKQLNTVANNVLEEGGTFQEADEISNLSGWALYSFVQQKSKIAADGYEDWLKGEMQNNDSIELEANGTTFTPSTAETLDQRNIALKALRRQYLIEQNLTDVNRALLDDKEVGFYDKVQSAHSTIMKGYEKDDAIDKGFKIRTDAVNDFAVNKDFESLLGTIKRTVKKDGTVHNRAEALDETFKILTDMAKTGQLTEDDLKDIQDQEIMIDGKPYKASRWKTRWLKLADEVTEYQNEVLKNEIESLENKGKKYIIDIQEKESKLQKEGKRFSEAEIDEMITNWDAKWGKVDSYLFDLKTRSSEDKIDEDIIEILEAKQKNLQPIYKEDVDQIQDFEKWKKWTKIIEETDLTLPSDIKTKRDERIKSTVEQRTLKNQDSIRGEKYTANMHQATDDYNKLYAEAITKKESPTEAHRYAIDIIEKNINDGVYDTWNYRKQDPSREHEQNLQTSLFAIGTNPSIITESVIPGTEEALKTYIKSKGKTVPIIFEQITTEYNKTAETPISPSYLATLQAEAAGNKIENVISDIDKETLELPKHVQQILLRHPDQYKVQRAKIEMLKEDGDISYNDVDYLIQEVAQMDIDKDNQLKPLPKDLKPRIGDWKDIKGIGYVVYDGEEWIRKGNKGRFKEAYIGNVENYRDIDNFVKPYDGNYKGDIPLGSWKKIPNAIGYVVWDGEKFVRSGNKGRGGEYEGELSNFVDLDGQVKNF